MKALNEPLAKKRFKFDGSITISVGERRTAAVWKNVDMLWSEFVEKLKRPTRTQETFAQYNALPVKQRDALKDVGGFVGGLLKEGKRKTKNVSWRSLVTLDADQAKKEILSTLSLLYGCAFVAYSTRSSSPENLRLRLIIPLARPVLPDEYPAISRRIAADLGMDCFDDTTHETARLMYWPSCSSDSEYLFHVSDDPWLDPDGILASYVDWRDPYYWPETAKAKVKRKKAIAEKQSDPQNKKGIVGAFCRTYNIPSAIENYLNDVYEPIGDGERYTYIPGSTTGGLVLYRAENGQTYDFAYSHHGTDPVSGLLVNAFDLVRIHKFGHLDKESESESSDTKSPSYKAMVELARNDENVRATIGTDSLEEAKKDFKSNDKDWLKRLEVNKSGGIEPSLSNLILILQNDPNLQGLAFNLHRDGIDVRGKVPWKRHKKGWQDVDDDNLRAYLERVYKIWAPSKYKNALAVVANERAFHPIRDYLNNLPEWDGVDRLDTLLIDYLGAEDSVYTRAVTRKTLCAAVARIFEPGKKFDHMLVLEGSQGLGKSTFFAKLCGDWFNDSLSMQDMRDKTGAEKLQGSWIVEIGELSGMRKIEIEVVKSFLSRQDDKYRASYGYRAEEHPRQCILVGTTNSTDGFLRDITGNRRFWPVSVTANRTKKPWDLTQDEIDLIWAEALHYYKQGENLYLTGDVEKMAYEAQREAMETDEREGLIREYLDRPVPENWYQMDLPARRAYLHGGDFGRPSEGTLVRDRICVLEIWCELFGKDAGSMRKQDSFELHGLMTKIENWERYKGNKRGTLWFPNYGAQRAYVRKL